MDPTEGSAVVAGEALEEPAERPSFSAAALKTHLLASYDLNMFSNASNYDLRQRVERRRSVRDLERLFFRTLAAWQPDLFIEAGSKDARTSRRARKLLDDARIVAFEANPYVHERYRAQNAEPAHRLEYLHLALSDAPGEVTFNVRRGPDGSPLADGQGSLKDMDGYEHGTMPVTVRCTTLDDHFADHPGGTCALWLDVEGAAEEVLTGGGRILSEAAMVFIEVEDRDMWTWGPAWTADDVAGYLFDRGLVPVARDYQSRYQYNVLFVSPELLQHHQFRLYLALHGSPAHQVEDAPDDRGLRRHVPSFASMRRWVNSARRRRGRRS